MTVASKKNHDKAVEELYQIFSKDLDIDKTEKFISKGQGDIDLAFYFNKTLVQFEVKTGGDNYVLTAFGDWIGRKKLKNSIELKINSKITSAKRNSFFCIPGVTKGVENQ